MKDWINMRKDWVWYYVGIRNCQKRSCLGLLMAVLLPCIAWALHVEVPPMTPWHADSEASTNVMFNRARQDVRDLKMHFTFEGGSSNCIQVAFGRDADGDGVLSFGETDVVYGWRRGRHFVEDVRSSARTEEADVTAGGALTVRMRMTKESLPELFAATNGTGRAMLEGFRSPVPVWLYRPEWNLMRVTRRGPGVPAEWFVCDIRYDDTYIIFR